MPSGSTGHFPQAKSIFILIRRTILYRRTDRVSFFILEQEKDTVTFFSAGFRDARKADFVLCCTHIGSLTEMLLSNFYDDFIRFEIIK